MRKFRVLPLTITLMTIGVAYKAGQTAQDGKELFSRFFVTSVQAQDAPKEAPQKEEEKKSEPPAEDKKPDETAKEGAKTELPTTAPTPDPAADMRPEEKRYSPTELDVLQQLAKRREKLDEWEKNITVKENLLTVTEKRIDEKLTQMDVLKKDLSEMLIQFNEQENAKVKSLVSIYENMKPRDAARIFDEVEMPILLLVIDKMSERKAAPILAGMDPKKVKQLTVELAEQRREKNTRIENKSSAVTKP